jgi:hypothetical protein
MEPSDFQLDPNLRSLLGDQLARGELVLFTGAGFSLDAPNRAGGSVPSSSELARLFWDIAFPDREFDSSSSLGDLYGCAVSRAEKATRNLVELQLRVQGRIPDYYRQWFSQPWMRIYTLNFDNLDFAVSSQGDLPIPITVTSAISDGFPTSSQNLASVHLNGTIDDFPDITFSQRQYGERLARPDTWYLQLVRDLMASPVIFVGTELSESPLWQHLELRGKRGPGRERRPRSYLVCPTLPAARQAMLQTFNVEWIPLGQQEFMEQILWPMTDEREQGLTITRRRLAPTRAVDVLLKVSDLRTQPSEEVREFLMGRQPEWADLADGGFAVVRQFETDLGARIEKSSPRVVALTGTAGSGKSTTLMRLGLEQHASGRDVRWLDLTSDVPLGRITQEIKRELPLVLLIDELNYLGNSAGVFISDLIESCPDLTVMVALRSSRYLDLAAQIDLEDGGLLEYTIPNLDDSDINALLAALEASGKLGKLKGMTPLMRIAALQREAGRQLLVAMLQATSGKRFDDKICSEVRDLEAGPAAVYGAVSLATHIRHGLTRHEALLAVGDVSRDTVGILQDLLDRRILIKRGDLIVARHRLIAEHVVKYLKREGHLAETVRGVVFSLATSVSAENHHSRPMSILVRLLNHDWLIENLHGQWDSVRAIYDQVEQTLGWDHHFWLQRGSFEVERGDLRIAEIYLESARSMAPDDYRVQTEWGYLQLRLATRDSQETGSVRLALDAFDELEDAISRRGDSDPYPFHVMGARGLEFVEVAPLGRDEKLKLLSRLRSVVDDGCRRHRKDQALTQLATRIERQFLIVGAVEGEESIVSS